MRRRDIIKAAGIGALAAPLAAGAQTTRQLKFVPNSDLSILDPVYTAAFVTRVHGLMAYDTLYGQDENLDPQPQMVAGHVVENDGKLWRLRLRDGLRFHDGEPVLARDVVASLQRWGRVDAFGQSLMAATEELSAPSDQEVVFRLKAPFPLLPAALGKSTAFLPVIMPARLASTAGNRPLTEVVGSGPFRYVAEERVDGVRSVWAKFEGYVPRPDGTPSFTAGPKIAHLDRVEWVTIPDDGTAFAALQRGEVDWWERPLIDMLPMLRRDQDIRIDVIDRTGYMGIVRLNHLQPPFSNSAIRRAILGAINQADMVGAVAGADASLTTDGVGAFCPESPMANNAGIEVLTSPRDRAKVRRDLAAAGYNGERVVFLTAANNAATNTLCVVVSDQLKQVGMNVDFVQLDFGAWLTRRNNRDSIDKGGWNATCTFLPGSDLWDPAAHLAIRGNGARAWAGWPTSERIESLRTAWFSAPDEAARKAICRDMQLQLWQDVPYIPGGRWRHPTAYRKRVSHVPRGVPLFYGTRVS